MTTPDWLQAEDTLTNDMVAALADLRDADAARAKALSDELRKMLELRQEAEGDSVQQEALDERIGEIERERVVAKKVATARTLDPRSPYFGHLVIEEDGKRRDALIGKGSVVDGRLPANVVDWRNAPISRLYYEYAEGEEWCEEIAGREREGVIAARRTVDISGGVLQSVETGSVVARKQVGGTWLVQDKGAVLERSERRDDPEDHALPDIVALITRDQFAVLTRPESGVVLLRGQAGSGKTTVALHRIAYLRYQDPERFALNRVLVVMFNKALQTYIGKALADLDLVGVQVSTFHAWALARLREGGLNPTFEAGAPFDVTAFKQDPDVEVLLQAAVDALGENLCNWLPVPDALRDVWADTPGTGLARVARFLDAHGDDVPDLAHKVHHRVGNHERDLMAALHLDVPLPDALARSLDAVRRWTADRPTLDFADAALLLRIGQLKGRAARRFAPPWLHRYAHIVVDEAQDLSAIAVRVLLDAADEHQSVTLAGDPAQTLYASGAFDLLGGGAARVDDALELDTLPVGHRSTRPIMALALRASGHTDDALLEATRPGHPVVWIQRGDGGVERVAQEITAFRRTRPKSIVAVLCRDVRTANQWHRDLDAALGNVRLGRRNDFTFAPGVVVSNVHQVKGLEFDGVVVVEPASYGMRDRNLLHVAITRAADRLWVVAEGGTGLIGPAG